MKEFCNMEEMRLRFRLRTVSAGLVGGRGGGQGDVWYMSGW